MTNQTKTLPADLHGIVGGNWVQEGGSGKVIACWGVVKFPEGTTLAEAPYRVHCAPLGLHRAALLAAQYNRFESKDRELFLALPLRWHGSEWRLTRVQFAEEVTD